jgi:hypothetical protein
MTTARSSRRSKRAAAGLTLLLIAAASAPASAHRRDEYLQAARIAIDPERVQIVLDLTPGISVAEGILAGIDRDGNGLISPQETHAYARELLRGIAVDVDGVSVGLDVAASTFPAVEAVRNGEGTMRVEAVGHVPRLAEGAHHLHYRNGDRADIGVYLANALVPASDRVAVTAQRRDRDQRDLIIDYVLQPETPSRARLQVPAAMGVASMSMAAFWWRRRHVECA